MNYYMYEIAWMNELLDKDAFWILFYENKFANGI